MSAELLMASALVWNLRLSSNSHSSVAKKLSHMALAELIAMIEDRQDERLPALAREALGSLVGQLRMVQAQILGLEKKLLAWHRASEASRRLETIPGVGVITATALVATIGDASQFHSGRQLAAWLGLVPRQHSTGGKSTLLGISKRGDVYLRQLIIHGARSVLRWVDRKTDRTSRWATALKERRHNNIAVVAMANKMVRVAFAILKKGETYRAEPTRVAA